MIRKGLCNVTIFVFVALFMSLGSTFAQPEIIDSFSSTEGWNIIASDGVKINISIVDGIHGNCLRLDYNFTKGAGYGGIQKNFPLSLKENFKFSYFIKGASPNNNLEFKLIDDSGENVWWVNNINYEFPTDWKKNIVKKKHIHFAWGPTEDKLLNSIGKLEFMIASYNGGAGTVYLDELSFETLPDVDPNPPEPVFTAISKSEEVFKITDGDLNTYWISNVSNEEEITIDLGSLREIGGLKITWLENNSPHKFEVSASSDEQNWESVYKSSLISGNINFVQLRELEAHLLKIKLVNSPDSFRSVGIKEIEILPSEFSSTDNRFFINLAAQYPRGYFPRYLNEEKSYWTIVGVNNDVKEALINEDGMIEIDKGNCSIEPFININGKLLSWNDVDLVQTLEEDYLPIPNVKWLYDGLSLDIKTFAEGEANKSSAIYAIYTLKNTSDKTLSGNVYLAIRPFQVNPYYQFLNLTGGVSKIKSIQHTTTFTQINFEKYIYSLTEPESFGAGTFDNGEIINFIAKDTLPEGNSIIDETGYASAAYRYNFNLNPDEEKTVVIAVPFYGKLLNQPTEESVVLKFNEVKNYWKSRLNEVEYNLPDSAQRIVNTIKSNLAYILINRDNAGIQPGSRSYERSWIRDGSLTSSALLKNGIVGEVKDFINWYSSYQLENGSVPCVVDRRGADPVPENDSHGELIFLIKQYFNYTHDTTFLASKYKNVIKAVEYINYLTSLRKTDHYKNGNDSVRSLYGLMPESISHEGYSAKPMHSYWDDFWTLKGLKDAVEIASLLGDKKLKEFENFRDEFKINLYNSIDLATKRKSINYIPGCAELGDFDATSTTIALYPCNELNNLPKDKLKYTFDKYFEFSMGRKKVDNIWVNYTPYEVRTIGSFILLDEIERAHKQLEFFLKDQRPGGWNQWAEVVWKDYRYPGFIGDMPHTWVGSDFINSMRTMFVYENEYDSSLVIAAGLYKEWIDSPGGISINNLPTYYGLLSYSVNKMQDYYLVNITGDLSLPAGGLILKNFNDKKNPTRLLIDGQESKDYKNDSIKVNKLPVQLKIYY